jgi:hypothetical protein
MGKLPSDRVKRYGSRTRGLRGIFGFLLGSGGRRGSGSGGVGVGRLLILGLGGIGIGPVGGGPEGQIVAQQLHDQGAVAVRLLGQGVELGDGVVKGLLGQVAGAVGRVEDLVVEDGEVEGKPEADRVGGGEFGLRDVGGILGILIICKIDMCIIYTPCRPRGRQWRRPCACCRKRTRRDSGGSHPSYGDIREMRDEEN